MRNKNLLRKIKRLMMMKEIIKNIRKSRRKAENNQVIRLKVIRRNNKDKEVNQKGKGTQKILMKVMQKRIRKLAMMMVRQRRQKAKRITKNQNQKMQVEEEEEVL